MASVYDVKPMFQDLLRPRVGRWVEAGVTPNQVTLAALALSGVAGTLVGLWPGARLPLLLLPLMLLLRMALNAIDGMMAREHDMKTPLGALLNEVGDAASDVLIYLPVALVPGIHAPLAVTVVLVGLVAEVAGLAGPLVGASRRYDGPMGKSDRALAYGIIGLLAGLGLPAKIVGNLILLAVLGLGLKTVVNRVRAALAEAPPAKEG